MVLAQAVPLPLADPQGPDQDQASNVIGRYRLGCVLGSGEFDCTIRLCEHIHTGDVLAVRIYQKSVLRAVDGAWAQLAEAVQVVRSLPKSDRVVETVECFETGAALYILMGFAPGLSLHRLMREARGAADVTIEDKRRIFVQLLRGVAHLHAHDVAHLSIAPDHVLAHRDAQSSTFGTQWKVKLTFLTSCKRVTAGERLQVLCGTSHTVAPEVLRTCIPHDAAAAAAVGPAHAAGYDPFAADVWSCGVVLYYLLSGGSYPFEGTDTHRRVLAHDVRPLDPRLPSDALDLQRRMMDPNPATRLTLEAAALHPFLSAAGAAKEAGAFEAAVGAQDGATRYVSVARHPVTGDVLLRLGGLAAALPRRERSARIIQAVWRFHALYVRNARAAGHSVGEKNPILHLFSVPETPHQHAAAAAVATPTAPAAAERRTGDGRGRFLSAISLGTRPVAPVEGTDAAALHFLSTFGPRVPTERCGGCGRVPHPRVALRQKPYQSTPYVFRDGQFIKESA